jgi:hypothetical protein
MARSINPCNYASRDDYYEAVDRARSVVDAAVPGLLSDEDVAMIKSAFDAATPPESDNTERPF